MSIYRNNIYDKILQQEEDEEAPAPTECNVKKETVSYNESGTACLVHGLQTRNNGQVGFFIKSPYADNLQFVKIGHTRKYGQVEFDTLPRSGNINTRCLITRTPFLVNVRLKLEVIRTVATDKPNVKGDSIQEEIELIKETPLVQGAKR